MFLSLDLIVTVTVSLLIFNFGRSVTIGARVGLLTSEILPSLLITTLLPFSESSSILPVKGLSSSVVGATVGLLTSETFPSLSTTTLLPF